MCRCGVLGLVGAVSRFLRLFVWYSPVGWLPRRSSVHIAVALGSRSANGTDGSTLQRASQPSRHKAHACFQIVCHQPFELLGALLWTSPVHEVVRSDYYLSNPTVDPQRSLKCLVTPARIEFRMWWHLVPEFYTLHGLCSPASDTRWKGRETLWGNACSGSESGFETTALNRFSQEISFKCSTSTCASWRSSTRWPLFILRWGARVSNYLPQRKSRAFMRYPRWHFPCKTCSSVFCISATFHKKSWSI